MYRCNTSKKLNLKDYAKALLAQEHFWTRAEKEQWRQSLKATLYSLRKLALQHVYVEEPTKQKLQQNSYRDLEHLISQVSHRLSAQTEHGLKR